MNGNADSRNLVVTTNYSHLQGTHMQLINDLLEFLLVREASLIFEYLHLSFLGFAASSQINLTKVTAMESTDKSKINQ